MKTGEYSKQLEDLFFKCLEQKTNWGRVELKIMYQKCQAIVLRNLIDLKAQK